jgi:hypothetical protein
MRFPRGLTEAWSWEGIGEYSSEEDFKRCLKELDDSEFKSRCRPSPPQGVFSSP